MKLDCLDGAPSSVCSDQGLARWIKLWVGGKSVDGDWLRVEGLFRVYRLHLAPRTMQVLGRLDIEAPHVERVAGERNPLEEVRVPVDLTRRDTLHGGLVDGGVDQTLAAILLAIPVGVLVEVSGASLGHTSDVDIELSGNVATHHGTEEVDESIHTVDSAVFAPHRLLLGIPPVLFGASAGREIAGSINVADAGTKHVVLSRAVSLRCAVVGSGEDDAGVLASLDDIADTNSEVLTLD